MAITEQNRVNKLLADGSQVLFNFNFPIASVNPDFTQDAGENLRVFLVKGNLEEEQVEGDDYVIVSTTESGGTVEFTVAPEQDDIVVLLLAPPILQTTVFEEAPTDFKTKALEGVFDYTQQTNLGQQNILTTIPKLRPSDAAETDPNVFDPNTKKRHVVGINEEESAWDLFPPEVLGPIQPPDFESPTTLNRALYFSSFNNNKGVLSTMPLQYSDEQDDIQSLISLAVEGGFKITQNGFDHNFTFIDRDFDIDFAFSTPVTNTVLTATVSGDTWTLGTKTEEVQADEDFESGAIPKVTNDNKPFLLAPSSLKDSGPEVESSKPLAITDYLEFRGSTVINQLLFGQTNGNYNVVFDLDPSTPVGLVVARASSSTVVLDSAPFDPDNIPSYPSPETNRLVFVDSINPTVFGNAAAETIRDSEDDLPVGVNITGTFTIQGDTGNPKEIRFEELSNEIAFNITDSGFIRATVAGGEATLQQDNANPNGVDYPAATEGAVPYASVVNGGDVTLADTNITRTSAFLTTISNQTLAERLFIGTTDNELTFAAAPSNIELDPTSVGEGETKLAAFVSDGGTDYRLVGIDGDGPGGEVNYPDPTDDFVPRVGTASTKTLIDSDISNPSGEVRILSNFKIRDSVTDTVFHEISFEPTIIQNILYNIQQAGVVIADYNSGNVTLRAIDPPSGSGDVVYPAPTNDFVPKVGNAGAKELTDSDIENPAGNVIVNADLRAMENFYIFDGGLYHELSFEPGFACDININVPRQGFAFLESTDDTTYDLVPRDIFQDEEDTFYPVFGTQSGNTVLAKGTLREAALAVETSKPLVAADYIGITALGLEHTIRFTGNDPQNVIWDLNDSGKLSVLRSGDDYLLQVTDAGEGEGDVSYPNPTLGSIPRVGDADSKELEDSSISEGIDGVLIGANTTIDSSAPLSPVLTLRQQLATQGISFYLDVDNNQRIRFPVDSGLTDIVFNFTSTQEVEEGNVVFTSETLNGRKIYRFAPSRSLSPETPTFLFNDRDASLVQDEPVITEFASNQPPTQTIGASGVLITDQGFSNIELQGLRVGSTTSTDVVLGDTTSVSLDLSGTTNFRLTIEGDTDITFLNTPDQAALFGQIVLVATGVPSILTWNDDTVWEDGVAVDFQPISTVPNAAQVLSLSVVSGNIYLAVVTEVIDQVDLETLLFFGDIVQDNPAVTTTSAVVLTDSAAGEITDEGFSNLTLSSISVTSHTDSDYEEDSATSVVLDGRNISISIISNLSFVLGSTDPQAAGAFYIFVQNPGGGDFTIDVGEGIYTSDQDNITVGDDPDDTDLFVCYRVQGSVYLTKANNREAE